MHAVCPIVRMDKHITNCATRTTRLALCWLYISRTLRQCLLQRQTNHFASTPQSALDLASHAEHSYNALQLHVRLLVAHKRSISLYTLHNIAQFDHLHKLKCIPHIEHQDMHRIASPFLVQTNCIAYLPESSRISIENTVENIHVSIFLLFNDILMKSVETFQFLTTQVKCRYISTAVL